jgi:DNA invertase Pin-like site-specific DNA recombinase
MTTAYSYIRFSSLKQQEGDSLKRQRDLIAEWADNNTKIEVKKSSYQDLGVSGYKGKHLTTEEGLGAFRDAVIQGKVESGSILLVEAIDRLGRQETTEQAELILSLLNKGIIIHTLEDDCTYSKEIVQTDASKIYILIGKIQASHDYSDRLARRLKSSRKTTREAVIDRFSVQVNHSDISSIWITKNCPSWITWVGTGDFNGQREIGNFILNNERASIVKNIFELYIAGSGTPAIANKLNKDNITSFNGKGWHGSYINKILFNRQAIGELTLNQRDKNKETIVVGYYPSAVHRELYIKAKQRKDVEYKEFRTTDKSKPFDIYSGIITCGMCGGRAKSYNKGKGYFVYQCCDSKRGCCEKPSSRMFNKHHIDHHISTYFSYHLSLLALRTKEHYFESTMENNFDIQPKENKLDRNRLIKQIALKKELYEDAVMENLGKDTVQGLREDYRYLQRELRDIDAAETEAREKIVNEKVFNRSFSPMDIKYSIYDWVNWKNASINEGTCKNKSNLVSEDNKRFINLLFQKTKITINLYREHVTLMLSNKVLLTIKKPKKTVMNTTSYDFEHVPFLEITNNIDKPLEGYIELSSEQESEAKSLLITNDLLSFL